MASLIIERKPNLEVKNKVSLLFGFSFIFSVQDGETPLIRAVKSRHVALVMLLRRSGAKLSPSDNNGDNALHLALRARSRRLAQALLGEYKKFIFNTFLFTCLFRKCTCNGEKITV